MASTSESIVKLNRILVKEAVEFSAEKPHGIIIKEWCQDDQSKSYPSWNVQMTGLKRTLWSDFKLDLLVQFPINYPNSPPSFRFISEIFHPNVYKDGTICLEILQPEYWDTTFKAWSILITIQCLLSDPYPDVAANHDAAKLYMNDRCEYEAVVNKLLALKFPTINIQKATSKTLKMESNAKKKFAIARINQDYREILKKGFLPVGISVDFFNEDELKCCGLMSGKRGTIFEEGLFRFEIQFCVDYPFIAPQVKFISKNIFHPNICPITGKISMKILKNDWSPCVNLGGILISMYSLLGEPELGESNLIVNEKAGFLIATDKNEYEKSVRELIKQTDDIMVVVDELIPVPLKADEVDQQSDVHSAVESAKNLPMESSKSQEFSVPVPSSHKHKKSIDLTEIEIQEKIRKLAEESKRLEEVIVKIQKKQGEKK